MSLWTVDPEGGVTNIEKNSLTDDVLYAMMINLNRGDIDITSKGGSRATEVKKGGYHWSLCHLFYIMFITYVYKNRMHITPPNILFTKTEIYESNFLKRSINKILWSEIFTL